MILDPRFNGPPGSGNGGVTCGLVAGLSGLEVAEVTLRLPPPLATHLAFEDGTLRHGSDVIATVQPGSVDLVAPEPVSFELALESPSALGGHPHPFPTCFVCGTDRDDGLGLLPSRVGDGLVATVWTPAADDPVMVWAALDCPGGWSADLPGRPMVLGRMTCSVSALPRPGDEHLVQGWLVGGEGRKVFTGSALYDASGTVLAVASATWITLSA